MSEQGPRPYPQAEEKRRAEARDRAGRGAALLDVKRPGWWKEIDLDELDLSCPCRCVSGQVFGNYTGGLDVLGLDWKGGKDEDVAHGFSLPVQLLPDYSYLQEAWEELIRKRKKEAARVGV